MWSANQSKYSDFKHMPCDTYIFFFCYYYVFFFFIELKIKKITKNFFPTCFQEISKNK